MDLAQKIIFDLGLIFFIAWGTILAAVAFIAFGRDLRKFLKSASQKEEQGLNPQLLNPPLKKASLRRA